MVAAALKHFGLTETSGSPTKNKPGPLLKHAGEERQRQWLCEQSTSIMNILITDPNQVHVVLCCQHFFSNSPTVLLILNGNLPTHHYFYNHTMYLTAKLTCQSVCDVQWCVSN